MSSSSLIKQLLQHQGDFMAYLMAMVRDLHAAEDIFQNAAVVVIEYPQPEEIRDFRAWGKEIMRRQALTYLREKGRTARHMSPLEPDLLQQIDRSFDEDTTDAIQRERELDALRECSGKLPEPQRTMVTMRYQRRISFEEIGAALGKTAGAIQRALSRSRKALHDCVQSRLAQPKFAPSKLSTSDEMTP
ncbi:MAG: sigma-70 family RNA polymerase sigma factor [Planctomycetes bacterium]|nr:sigma-70 family RNA polymerase sigma factor [Planctomycetota bacterium]